MVFPLHLARFKYNLGMDSVERYWAKVDFSNPTGCWLWTASTTRDGYGRWQPESGQNVLAHRFGWELLHGSIPAGLEVCHRCDTPSCQRPDHLFLGTHAENMADCSAKGRINRESRNQGSKHGYSKVNEDMVLEIRRRSQAGEPGLAIAKAFGISRANVSLIVNRKAWTHI